MEKRKIIIIIGIIAVICGILCLYFNTGLKGFEKRVSKISLPENIEIVTMKSGIGDSGGNGDYSTYRVVLVIKTEMSFDELNNEFEKRNLTSSSHIANSNTPFCYITPCNSKVFESARNFKLLFDELDNINDFSNYYFIEFIK